MYYRFHCDNGIPAGDFGATLTKNLAFKMSRLYDHSNLQVSSQLGLLCGDGASLVEVYQGMSDSRSRGRLDDLESSSSSSDSSV